MRYFFFEKQIEVLSKDETYEAQGLFPEQQLFRPHILTKEPYYLACQPTKILQPTPHPENKITTLGRSICKPQLTV